jgi:ParB family chromosome partitioning protein
MKVKVSEIKVQTRVRKELGDLTGLKKSIQQYGLLNPILIDLQGNLIAGFRRLEAIKSLGWEYTEVKVLDVKNSKDRLLLEVEENTHRRDFSPEEIDRSTEFLEKLNETGWKKFWSELWSNLRKG